MEIELCLLNAKTKTTTSSMNMHIYGKKHNTVSESVKTIMPHRSLTTATPCREGGRGRTRLSVPYACLPDRIGLMGNPSDGFHGKTISLSIANFWADVTIQESSKLVSLLVLGCYLNG